MEQPKSVTVIRDFINWYLDEDEVPALFECPPELSSPLPFSTFSAAAAEEDLTEGRSFLKIDFSLPDPDLSPLSLLDEKKLDFFFCCFGDDSSTELPEITEPEPVTIAGAGAGAAAVCPSLGSVPPSAADDELAVSWKPLMSGNMWPGCISCRVMTSIEPWLPKAVLCGTWGRMENLQCK